MGHDLPAPLWPLVTGTILGFTSMVEATSATPAGVAGVA